MVADRVLIERARHLRRLILRHTPNDNQRSIGLFIAHGHYERLLAKHRTSLEVRAKRIGEALHHYLPSWKFRVPQSGSALWVQGPEHLAMKQVELDARKAQC